jgi:hypothetical protein
VYGHLVPDFGRRTNSGLSVLFAEAASIGAWINVSMRMNMQAGHMRFSTRQKESFYGP